MLLLRLPSAVELHTPQCCAESRNTALMNAVEKPVNVYLTKVKKQVKGNSFNSL